MEEGTITKWLAKEGEQTTEGAPLFEMETDKLTITMDSTATGTVGGSRCVVGVLDSRFLMGSMSAAVGEKLTLAIEYAGKNKLPLILFAASGGAPARTAPVWVPLEDRVQLALLLAKGYAALDSRPYGGSLAPARSPLQGTA